jgi:hypothetical protein
MALERRLFARAWKSLHLHERFVGLLLFGVGFAVLWMMYAFWSSGFASAVNPPLPSGMKPNMAFAFNPIVCMFPFISIGAIGLMVLGIRRALWPG